MTNYSNEELAGDICNSVNDLRSHVAGIEFDSGQLTTRHQRADQRSRSSLRKLLEIALNDVPYYAGLRVASNEAGEVTLHDFPIVDKQTIRTNFADFIARDSYTYELKPGRKFIVSTSGSTGEPCHLIRDGEGANADRYVMELLMRDLEVPARGDTVDLGLRPVGGPLLSITNRWPIGIQWNMPMYQSGDIAIRTYYECMMDMSEPVLLFGNSKLLDLAKLYMGSKASWNLAGIVWSYETLLPGVREYLEDTFQTRVYSIYGTAETGCIAFECTNGSMHFPPTVSIPEIVDENGGSLFDNDTVGNVVLTALNSASMPIIRYRTGDLAHWNETCECGDTMQAIQGIIGRESVRLYTRDGRSFTPYFLLSTLSETGMTDFQVVQSSLSRIEVRYSTICNLPTEFWGIVTEHLVEYGMDFELVPCEGADYLLASSGKRNAVVQLIDHSYEVADDIDNVVIAK